MEVSGITAAACNCSRCEEINGTYFVSVHGSRPIAFRENDWYGSMCSAQQPYSICQSNLRGPHNDPTVVRGFEHVVVNLAQVGGAYVLSCEIQSAGGITGTGVVMRWQKTYAAPPNCEGWDQEELAFAATTGGDLDQRCDGSGSLVKLTAMPADCEIGDPCVLRDAGCFICRENQLPPEIDVTFPSDWTAGPACGTLLDGLYPCTCNCGQATGTFTCQFAGTITDTCVWSYQFPSHPGSACAWSRLIVMLSNGPGGPYIDVFLYYWRPVAGNSMAEVVRANWSKPLSLSPCGEFLDCDTIGTQSVPFAFHNPLSDSSCLWGGSPLDVTVVP